MIFKKVYNLAASLKGGAAMDYAVGNSLPPPLTLYRVPSACTLSTESFSIDRKDSLDYFRLKHRYILRYLAIFIGFVVVIVAMLFSFLTLKQSLFGYCFLGCAGIFTGIIVGATFKSVSVNIIERDTIVKPTCPMQNPAGTFKSFNCVDCTMSKLNLPPKQIDKMRKAG